MGYRSGLDAPGGADDLVLSGMIGMAHKYAGDGGEKTHVAEADFAGNVLTTDPDTWRTCARR
jgi:hypothetical protein